MDCSKVGKLIYDLRTERRMTQKQLADAMNISDKTVSKWERGLGCPDVSLLHELSELLQTNVEQLLLGDLEPKDLNGGNMKKIKFYVCPTCKNIIAATGEAYIVCCGRKLVPQEVQQDNEKHHLNVEVVEDEYCITFTHPMTKEHYLNFIAYVSVDKILLQRLYPEQGNEIRFPIMHGGQFYFGCNQHGLFINE